jgi:hypothetical protein
MSAMLSTEFDGAQAEVLPSVTSWPFCKRTHSAVGISNSPAACGGFVTIPVLPF